MNLTMAIVDEHYIRETAYHLWEKDGRPIGQDHHHWEMAKRIAGDATSPKSAPAAAPRKKRAAAKAGAKAR